MYRSSKNVSSSRIWKAAHLFSVFVGLLLSPVVAPAQSGGSIGPDVPSGLSWGTISYYAGGGTQQLANGVLATDLASFSSTAIAIDSQGNVYLANNNNIYLVYTEGAKIPPLLQAVLAGSNPTGGAIYLVAGINTYQCDGTSLNPCADGSALQASFGLIAAMAFDGNDNLYVADEAASAIRRIDHQSMAVTTIAGQLNNPSPFGSTDVGDNSPATSATFFFESDVKVDPSGNLFIADGNYEVRVVYQGSAVPPVLAAEGVTPQKGYIYRVAGTTGLSCSAAGTCGQNGPALSASFGYDVGVGLDGAGNVYVTDSTTDTIDVVYVGGDVPPILKTVTSAPAAGSIYEIAGQEFTACTTAPCGDTGPALQAYLNGPYHLHIDSGGNLYFTDQSDYTIRKVDAAGYISASAGTESPGVPGASTGNGGAATSAQFAAVTDFAIDAQNSLYVLDATVVWRAIAAAAQTISFPAISPKTYGAPPIALDAVAEDSQGNPTKLPITYSATGPGTISASNLIITGAGTIQITATQVGNAQYAPATATQSLTVDQALLTVSALPAFITIKATQFPTFQADFAGFVNGDTQQTAVIGTPAFSTPAILGKCGTYPINVSKGSLAAANYNFTFAPGQLTIGGTEGQSITFLPLGSVTYGQTSTITLTATAKPSGLPVQFTLISGPAKLSGATLQITGGGSITIEADQSGNCTYAAATPVTQTLTVNPAPLTVTGPVFSLSYGTTVNPATFPPPTITGFVGNDTQALVTGSPQYTTQASGTPQAGQSFPVNVALGSLALEPGAASNYYFAKPYLPGALTIVPAAQTIVFDQLTNSVYGSFVTVHAVSKDAQGNALGLPVTITATSPGIFFDVRSNSIVLTTSFPTDNLYSTGAGTVTVTATQPGTTDYAAAPPVSQTITFAQAPLSVTATPFTREAGAANPTLTYTLGCPGGAATNGCYGFVNNDSDIPSVVSGTPNLSTSADPSSPAGTYPIVITQGTLVAPNYTFNFVNGTLTVLPAGNYSITASPGSLTIPAGQSRQTTLTITTTNLYQGTVTLSCGQLPENVSCIFSPATYTFTGSNNQAGGANPAVGTLTVNTLGGQPVVGALSSDQSKIFRAIVSPIAGSFLVIVILVRRNRVMKHLTGRYLLLCLALGIGALGLGSCGGTSTGPLLAKPGSFTLTISGTGTTPSGNGNVSQSLNLDVTIQ